MLPKNSLVLGLAGVLAGLLAAASGPAGAQDVMMCRGKVAPIENIAPDDEPWTFVGTDGDDVIIGGIGPDIIDGGDGDDTICGLDGFDQIEGGNGRDLIDGGRGIDILDGGRGADRILGGAGNDILLGGVGNDKIFGQTGKDEIWGGKGNDSLVGGPGRDSLIGNIGVLDLLIGSDGLDRCNEFAGRTRACEVENDGCPKFAGATCSEEELEYFSWIVVDY